MLAWLAFIMTEVANLPLDANEVYKQGEIFIADSGIKKPRQIWVEQDSPSLTRTTFITGHMTSSTVQAGMVYFAPFAHL